MTRGSRWHSACRLRMLSRTSGDRQTRRSKTTGLSPLVWRLRATCWAPSWIRAHSCCRLFDATYSLDASEQTGLLVFGWIIIILRIRTQQLITTDLDRRMITDIQQFLPTHRAAHFNVDASSEELKEGALHGKTKLLLTPGMSDSDVFAMRRKIMAQYSTGANRDWPRGL